MLGYTGRYEVQFRHVGEAFGRHQMLNSDDRGVAEHAYAESVAKVNHLGSCTDIAGIRLIDTESGELLAGMEWVR